MYNHFYGYFMVFQPKNQFWKLGQQANTEKQTMLADTMREIVITGLEPYLEKLTKLALAEQTGFEISKEDIQYMDRIERLFEYATPKYARVEHSGANGTPLSLSVVHYGAALPNNEIKTQLEPITATIIDKPTIDSTIGIKELKTNSIGSDIVGGSDIVQVSG